MYSYVLGLSYYLLAFTNYQDDDDHHHQQIHCQLLIIG